MDLIRFKSVNGAWWAQTSLLTVLLEIQKRPIPNPSSLFLFIHTALDVEIFCHPFNSFLPAVRFRHNVKPFSFVLHAHKTTVILECVRELNASERMLRFASSQWKCLNSKSP